MDFYFGDLKIADTTDTIRTNPAANTYEITSYSAAINLAKVLYGDVSLHSRGQLDAQHGWRMTHYAETRGSKQRAASVHGDGTLTLTQNNETRNEPAQDLPVYDVLAALYRSYILQAPAFGKFRFTDGWRLRDYDYEDGGRETLSTPFGEVDTVVVVRHKSNGARRRIWLAPQLGYLPVRVLIENENSTFRLITQSISHHSTDDGTQA